MLKNTAEQNNQRNDDRKLLKRFSSLMMKCERKYVEGDSFEA